MSNRTIAIIFVALSWLMLVLSVGIAVPLFIIYSLVCVFLSHVIYHKQDKDDGPKPNIRL
jgi:membrane protein implicated in regulation of membrane protease activity